MRFHTLTLLSTLANKFLGGLAAPQVSNWDGMRMTVKHAWNVIPESWENLSYPPHGTTIDLHLALKSHSENALIDALYEVSDPKNPKYGAHLSKEQVAELVAPHPDTLKLVNSWLEHHGVPPSSVSTTLGGNWLTVIGVSVPQANEILGASYQLYHHVKTNDTALRTISYSLPDALHGHVQTVVPTTYFGSPLAGAKNPHMHPGAGAVARGNAGSGSPLTPLSSRDEYVTPSYLRWLYKTMGYVPAAADQNVLGIAGYLGQYPSPQDLTTFMQELRTDGTDAVFTVVQINGGGNDPNNAGQEASLNIQYTEAIAYPTPHIYYSIGGGKMGTATDPYVSWFKHLLVQKRPPQTISTSYGNFEHDVPRDYAEKVCELFAQLGLRGVSVLIGSGDRGVGQGVCLIPDSTGRLHHRFIPEFPASCPWVTTVGGTMGDEPEVAASFSGGGFSNYFHRPDYQVNVVPTFLQNFGDKYKDLYNPQGRATPDIAAQAFNFVILCNGKPEFVGGTSASGPTVAGIISLLNDYLISKGKDPLGFLNPWLYGSGHKGLNDIASGSNPGCGTDGFTAIVGWDPVTGLGTPNFDKLEEIIDDQIWASRVPKPTNQLT